MKRLSITTRILIGLVLGIIVGLFFTSSPGTASTYIKPFGDLFLNLIKMIIVPLLLSSLVVGAASTGDVGKLGRIGIKTLAYYLLTTTGCSPSTLEGYYHTVYLGCALHAGLVYSTLVWLFARMSPIKFFKGAAPAMMMAFTTSSSSATLPVTMESSEKNLGVSKSIL